MDDFLKAENDTLVRRIWAPNRRIAPKHHGAASIVVPMPERHETRDAQEQEAKASVRGDSLALRILERPIDIVVATTALILFLPLMIVIAILIRLDSPGPALFRQTRLGRERRARNGGRATDTSIESGPERRQRELASSPFEFMKFRTMFVDARERFPELYRYQYTQEEISTIKFKLDRDPRLTRVGVWLRRTSLDELPNLWNVLMGQITLVGPRPEIPEMSPYYTAAQRRKFLVTPGVTGLAQVRGRGRLSFQETVAFDVEYVERRSLRLNLVILWKTFVAVVLCRGAF